MEELEQNRRGLSTGVWLLILLCTGAIILTLASGAAYTAIRDARRTAAKASLGQIESVLYLAEKVAVDNGLTAMEGSYSGLLTSYNPAEQENLTAYETYVLDAMLANFGEERDFDFAVTRYEDGGGAHVYVYYFPVKGRTDLMRDKYYLAIDSQFYEYNTL